MNPTDEQDLIGIARIARPHGVKGEVTADLMTDFPERFGTIETVTARRPDGSLVRLKLTGHRFHKGRVILKFDGYGSVERAEELRNATLVVERRDLVKLPRDSYYNFDLIGCRVEVAGGGELGLVEEVRDFGAAPLLVVAGEDAGGPREYLIPFTREICPRVDIAGRVIEIAPPDGLLEL